MVEKNKLFTTHVAEVPEVRLEMKIIADFLAEKGYTLEKLKDLPAEEARLLRIEASKYASSRLAELEARAHFINIIHSATQSAIA